MSPSSRTKLETVEKQQKTNLEKFTEGENKDVPSMIACRLVKFITTHFLISLPYLRPLEEMKSLFFEDKNVEIVDIILEKETKPKRKEKRANTRKSKVENKKQNPKSNLNEDSFDSNTIFPNPLYNFEEFLLGKRHDPAPSKQSRKSSGPGRMTFLDPVFSPLFISDFTPSRSYSEGLGHRLSDIRSVLKMSFCHSH